MVPIDESLSVNQNSGGSVKFSRNKKSTLQCEFPWILDDKTKASDQNCARNDRLTIKRTHLAQNSNNMITQLASKYDSKNMMMVSM